MYRIPRLHTAFVLIAIALWGYRRSLKAGSVWKEVGTVPEGTVYKIEDDVFMLKAAHMHEAHCVISNNTLVGFFLPFEQAFVIVTEKVPLSIKPKIRSTHAFSESGILRDRRLDGDGLRRHRPPCIKKSPHRSRRIRDAWCFSARIPCLARQ